MAYDDEILSIIPAEGWWVIFLSDEEPFWFKRKLVCWGLMQPSEKEIRASSLPAGYKYIEGFDGGDTIETCSDNKSFQIYIHEDELDDEVIAGFAEEGKMRLAEKA